MEPLKDGDVVTYETGEFAGKPLIFGTWHWPSANDKDATVRTTIPYHGSKEASQLELLKTLAHERHAAAIDGLFKISRMHEQLNGR
jgi:hypothetical protein